MAIRVLWDEKETAVLVDYYMRFVRSEISRSQAVQGASAELRDLAVRNGIPIDEKFRNESGIAMQMVKIEDYYTGQKRRLRKGPQVFYDVVDMYTNDYKTFKNLLKEAREAKENNDGESVEEEYKRWLSEKLSLSATQISKFYYVYPEIESYFQQTGILTKALFKTSDIYVIGKIMSLMESDRNYVYSVRMQIKKRKEKKSRRERREQEKEQLEKQKTAINYYYNFLVGKNMADGNVKESEPEGRQEEAQNPNQGEFHSSGTEDAPVSFTVKGSEEVSSAVENEGTGNKEKTGDLTNPDEDTASEDSIVHAADGRTDAFENAEEETHPKLSEEEKVEKTHEDDPTGEGQVEEEASDPTIATEDASPADDIVPADSPVQFSEVASQSVINNENLLRVDFRGKATYYFTYPDKLIYFGKEYEVSKWPQAIALTARCLYKDYPDFIASVKNRYKGQYISDAAGTARMKAPQKIADDLFVETYMDSTSAVSRIRYFLDVCGVAYENIAILYHSVVDSDPPVKRDPKVGAAEKPDEKIKIAVAERTERQEGTGDEPSAEKQKETGGEIRAEVQKEDPLISYLQEKGAEYIDDRSKGGSLWILGGYEIIRLIMDCREKFGVYFASRYGAKELNGRNGWKLYNRQTKRMAPKRTVSVKVQETKVPETSGEVKVPYRSTDSNLIKTEGSDSSAVTTDAETLDSGEIKKEGSETQRWLSEAELMEFEASSFKVTSRGEFTVWILSEDKEAQDRLSAEDAAYNIKLCEVIASQNGWKDAKLYDVNYKRAAETARQMLADPKINGEQNSNRKWVYRTLIKFLRYLGAGSDVKKKETEIPRKKEDSISYEETAVSADSALQPEKGAEASSDKGKEEQSQFTSKEKTGMVSAELSVRESSVLEEKKGSAESSAKSKNEIIAGISLDSLKSTENSSESLQEEMRLDFSSEKAYYGSTCPDTLVYFGRKYAVISWTRLLVQIVRCLYEDYPAAILSLRDNKLISHVTDRNGKSRLTAPKQIAEDVYIERSLSATNIVKRIKYYLDSCKVNYNDIVILYHSTGSDSDSEKTEIDKEEQLIPEERGAVLTKVLSEEKMTDTDPFIAFLQEKQVRYTDNRDQGGNLWVIGDYELKDFINECSATYNVRFRFRYWVKEINGQNGWQLYYPKTYEEPARKSVSAKIEDAQEEIKEQERQVNTPEAKVQDQTKEKEIKTVIIPDINSNPTTDSVEHVDQNLYNPPNKDGSETGSVPTEGVEVYTLRPHSYGAEEISDVTKTYSSIRYEKPEEVKNICSLLEGKFQQGFIPGTINYTKLKNYYREKYQKSLNLSDGEIEDILKNNCLADSKKYYAYASLLDVQTQQNLQEYINNEVFAHKIVFYEKIMEHFKKDFVSSMKNVAILKKYLEEIIGGYKYEEEYLYSGESCNTYELLENAVEQMLLEEGCAVSVEKIKFSLDWIPEEYISKVLVRDRNIITTNNDLRFHIDLLYFSDGEMERIERIIQKEIDRNRYIFSKELLDSIRREMPSVYERIDGFGERGGRNTIAKKLSHKFNFKSNIICGKSDNFENAEIFRTFAEERGYFTMQSLRELKDEIGVAVIYFDDVNKTASRIDPEKYVPNSTLHFNVEKTDAVIEEYMHDDFCSITEVSNFTFFPSLDYSWNIYLLESYAAKFSSKFRLVHSRYNETKCVGAIVRKNSSIKSMDDVIVAFLKEKGNVATEAEALDELVKEGYIVKKKYDGIGDLLKKANREG